MDIILLGLQCLLTSVSKVLKSAIVSNIIPFSVDLAYVYWCSESSKLGNNLFDETLRRKDKADSIRNALGVLQRFRFLFNLPSNIERNVKNVRRLQ